MHTTVARMAVVSLLISAIAACIPNSPNVTPLQPINTAFRGKSNDTTDCPGPYFKITVPQPGGGVVLQDQVMVAETRSKVPEFHDCQRFIQSAGSYGKLFAVFASFRAREIDAELKQFLKDTALTSDEIPAVVAAEIFTAEGSYEALGIRPGFSCLYLSDRDDWRTAYMVYTGWTEENCLHIRVFGTHSTPNVTQLAVRRTTYTGLAADKYPNAARWEVASGNRYMILVTCGPGLCTVGGPSGGSVAVSMPGTDADVTSFVGDWYDEQELSRPAPSGGNALVPSTIHGRVIPASGLGDMMDPTTFKTDWVHVGTIHLGENEGPYFKKLGLRQGDNQLYLKGKVGNPNWKARIISARNDTTYRDVLRHGHDGEGLEVPGTMRWRWLPNDETIWARCLEGCCQVQEMDL